MSDTRRERQSPSAFRSTRTGPSLSWGAVIAGSLLAVIIQFMLGLFGLGIGFSAIASGQQAGASAPGLLSVEGIWTLVVVLVGLFAGAFATGRMAGLSAKVDAVLHGGLTWALSTLAVVALLTLAASPVIGGAFGAVGTTMQSLGQVAQTRMPGSVQGLPDDLRAQAQTLLATDSGANAAAGSAGGGSANEGGDGGSADAAGSTDQGAGSASNGTDDAGAGNADPVAVLVAGIDETASPSERQSAIRLIAQQTNISEQAAERRLQGFQQQYDEAMQEIRVSADRALQAVSTAAFSAFVALLLGLGVSCGGALLGRPRRQPL